MRKNKKKWKKSEYLNLTFILWSYFEVVQEIPLPASFNILSHLQFHTNNQASISSVERNIVQKAE